MQPPVTSHANPSLLKDVERKEVVDRLPGEEMLEPGSIVLRDVQQLLGAEMPGEIRLLDRAAFRTNNFGEGNFLRRAKEFRCWDRCYPIMRANAFGERDLTHRPIQRRNW